jgi:multidrug transporter EmrE-like cation transporter
MGYFLFGEIVSVRWMVGVVAMLFGVVLIQPHSSAKMKEA